MLSTLLGVVALVGPGPSEPAEVPVEPEAAQVEPHSLVERAQAHREAGEFDVALELIDDAILADPEFAVLYLFRGQLQVDMAQAEEGLTRSQLLTGAAADLDRYLSRTPGDEGRQPLVEQRDALLAEAEEARRSALAQPSERDPVPKLTPEALPEEQPPSAISIEPRPTPTDTRRDPIVPTVWAGAGLLAVTGAIFGANSFVAVQRCDQLCEADVEAQPVGLSIAAGGSAVATGLAAWGTHRWATRASARNRRVFTIVTGTLGASTLVAAVVTGALAATRWNGASPSSEGDLSGTQRLSNAATASGVFVAPLISSALVSALTKSSRRRATARR